MSTNTTSKRIARYLIDACKAKGAVSFSVWSEGENLTEGETSTAVRTIIEDMHACDDVDLVAYDGAGERLGRFLFIPSNEEDNPSDYGVNPFADAVVDLVMERIDRITQG